LPVPKIFIVEDFAPNAFATGRNPEHAVVAVTSGLLAILDKNELEGVIAHELSHIGNRDMLVMTLLTISLFLLGYGFGKKRGGRINRIEGTLLLLVYVGYNAYLAMTAF
jgi:heat shock protein HtpX